MTNQAKDTLARGGASSRGGDGARALRLRFLRELPTAADAVSSELRKNTHPVVKMVLWLGSQPIPFNEQPPAMQQRVPKAYLDTYADTGLSLRADFSSLLASWGNGLTNELKRNARDLLEIEPDIAFVERELKQTRTEVEKREIQSWRDWLFPGWLTEYPAEIDRRKLLEAIFLGQLNGNRKAAVCDAILQGVREHLGAARTEALDEARILISKARSALLAADLPQKPSDPFKRRIAKLIEESPGTSHREILGRIDTEYEKRHGEIPKRFKRHEHRRPGMVMVGAYDCKMCGHVVESYMSQIREPLGLKRAPKSRRQ
jgi:hypothetical protein